MDMQKTFTRSGVTKPLMIIAAVSCSVFLLDKGVELIHKQASSRLMQCSVSATENTDKFGYSILAGLAQSKAADFEGMNLTVALERFSSKVDRGFSENSTLESCKVLALVYLKVYQ